MNRYGIVRRNLSFANFAVNRYKPQFQPKESLSVYDNYLKISGLMLYWAEGTFKGNTVDFANSDPDMIKIFLRFLREICGIKEERLRIYLYAYSYQDITKIKRFWHKITGIPLKQFTKPFIRHNDHFSNRKLTFGLIHVRYNDKKLLFLIKEWLEKYKLQWTGTQVAKGDRLYARAAHNSNVMWKSG